jgi:MoaA/NifB/PqqE/SkfB family radical SAM enzyme
MSFISRFIYFVNNYCNLHCELCSTFSNEEPRWDAPLDEVELFCRRFDGIAMDKYTHLSGGEPTAIDEDKFAEMINIFHRYNRLLVLVSNGYNIFGIDQNILKKIDIIKLDDHGINHDHIEDCVRYLKSFYEGKIHPIETLIHYDLARTRRLSINQGELCNRETLRMKIEVLIKRGVIYPCCAMASFDQYNKDKRLEEELVKAKWVLDNRNIVDTLKSWKITLPQYAWDQCIYSCWWPYKQILGGTEITLKPNDVIKKLD